VRAPTLLGVPYDAGSSFRAGAAAAPAAIRAELWSPAGNPWSEALVDLSAEGALGDAGDVEFAGLAAGDSAGARARIERAVERLVAAGRRPLALGGDHSITYPLLAALRRSDPVAAARLTLLVFDAHPDLNDVFEGDRFSHACPFARIAEEGLVERLVEVGIRTLTAHQRAQAERFGVELVDMRRWSAGARPTIEGPVYLSIDLDGLDPSFAPGVAHREPGGLAVRELLGEIQRLAGPIVGADVVELNPELDLGGVTARVAAKLVKEIASRMIETG
jgi:agmatinase